MYTTNKIDDLAEVLGKFFEVILEDHTPRCDNCGIGHHKLTLYPDSGEMLCGDCRLEYEEFDRQAINH